MPFGGGLRASKSALAALNDALCVDVFLNELAAREHVHALLREAQRPALLLRRERQPLLQQRQGQEQVLG
jgi:hypothetical protein